MGEPTDAVFEGGPLDGDGCPIRGDKITIPVDAAGAAILYRGRDLVPSAPRAGRVTYADTGRRTADGRRVFAVEGGA